MNIFKRKNDKKNEKLFLVLSIILIFLLLLIFILSLMGFANASDVKVSTDKKRYSEGEILNIKILNQKDIPISYKKIVDRIWGIQLLEKGEWNGSTEVIFEEKGKYFLEDKVKNSDETCQIIPDFSNVASSLPSGDEISIGWDQMGCLAASRDTKTYIKRVKSGTYRISFSFSYKTTDGSGSEVIVSETVYSQPFNIK